MTAPATTTAPEPALVTAVYNLVFGGALDTNDLVVWHDELTRRIAVAEAALDMARRQRAMVVAHLHDTFGMQYADIAAAAKDPLSPQRAGQLAAKGRQSEHFRRLDPGGHRHP